MKGTAKTHILSTVMSIMLVLGLLSGIFAPAALAVDNAPDRNIFSYAIREARNAVEDGTVARLVPSVKVRFQAALTEAETLYAKSDATAAEIQKGYTDLQEVIWLLSYVQADKAKLQKAIDRAEATDLTPYSASKIQAVAVALERANAVLGNEEMSAGDQSTVDAATAALVNALDNLDQSSGGNGGTGGGSTPKPTEPEKPTEGKPVEEVFADVKAGAWYVSEVQYVVDNGLMQGTDAGFQPEAKTSRAMLLTVLYRMAGSPAQTEAGGQWYAAPVAWAASVGITSGASPESNITREQIAVLLYRYAKGRAPTGDLSAYSDADGVSDWAKEAMIWAVKEGLITGTGDNRLNAQGEATRAEVAALLARFDKMSKKG